MFRGRVVVYRETEADVGSFHAGLLDLPACIDIDTKCIEDFGRTSSGSRSVSMFSDLGSTGSSDDCSSSRHIECLGSASGTSGIQELIGGYSKFESVNLVTHHSCSTDKFFHGGQASGHQCKKRADFRMVRLAGHDRFEC